MEKIGGYRILKNLLNKKMDIGRELGKWEYKLLKLVSMECSNCDFAQLYYPDKVETVCPKCQSNMEKKHTELYDVFNENGEEIELIHGLVEYDMGCAIHQCNKKYNKESVFFYAGLYLIPDFATRYEYLYVCEKHYKEILDYFGLSHLYSEDTFKLDSLKEIDLSKYTIEIKSDNKDEISCMDDVLIELEKLRKY